MHTRSYAHARVRRWFECLDVDNQGYITKQQFRNFVRLQQSKQVLTGDDLMKRGLQ